MEKDCLDSLAVNYHSDLSQIAGLASYYDGSGSIGRRYARADEVGVSWAVTIDLESVENQTATIRRRDDGVQVRVSLDTMTEHLIAGTVSELF